MPPSTEAKHRVLLYALLLLMFSATGLRLCRSPSLSLSSRLFSTSSVVVQTAAEQDVAAAHRLLAEHFGGQQRVLLVGEGDFGFSKTLANSYATIKYASLTSSVWDDEKHLFASFLNAQQNVEYIKNQPCSEVLFGIDATKLETHFPPTASSSVGGGRGRFDTICWLFPHIAGKQNIKHNRQLLLDFFSSASQLQPSCIKIALATGQSGTKAASTEEWLHSWKLVDACAEAGLVLSSASKFDVKALEGLGYAPQGHRGWGGGFRTGNESEMFTLAVAPYVRGTMSTKIVAHQAPCYVHEVHLLHQVLVEDPSLFEKKAHVAIEKIIFDGSCDNSPLWAVHLVDVYIDPKTKLISHTLQIALCSTTSALGRTKADLLRQDIEQRLPALLGMDLRMEKAGGKVSQAHSWGVALMLKTRGELAYTNAASSPSSSSTSTSTSSTNQLNAALRILEDSSNNTDSSSSSSSSIDTNGEGGADDAQLREIKLLARSLWKRRVGVLIKQFGSVDND